MRVWGPNVVCTVVVASAALAGLSPRAAAQGNERVFIAKDTTGRGVAALGRTPHQIRGYTTQFAPEPLKVNIGNVDSPEQCIRVKASFTSLSGASSSGDVQSALILGPSVEGLPFQIAFGGRAGIQGSRGGLFMCAYLSGSSLIGTITKGLGLGS